MSDFLEDEWVDLIRSRLAEPLPFWKQAACPHTDTTPPDEFGVAICTACGATPTVELTERGFMRAVRRVLR